MKRSFLTAKFNLKNRISLVYITALCFLCLDLSSLAFSQQTEKETQILDVDSIDLERIVVTPCRWPGIVRDAPSKVTVIDEEVIKETRAQNIDDLLRIIPGVDIVRQSGFLSSDPKVSLRGLYSLKRTLVLLDGVPLNNIYGHQVYWNAIPVEAVERIEVVPGIASSLYGSGAMGGVINIITKRPTKRAIKLNSEYGSFATRSFDLTYADKINQLSYSFYGDFFKSDGYIAVLPENRKDYDIRRTRENKDFRLRVFYDFDEDSEAWTGYTHYQEDINAGRRYYFGSRDLNSLNFGFKKDFGRIDRITLNTNLYFNWEDFSWTYDKSPSYTSIDYVSTIPKQDWGMSLQVNLPINEINTLSVGTDYRWGKMNANFDYYTSTRWVNCRGKQKTVALYFQDETNFSNKWLLYLGGRLDWWESFDGYLYDDNLNPKVTIYPDRSDNEFSPKAGIVFHLSEDTTIRGSIGKAFRAPCLYELYRTTKYPSGRTYKANPNLSPETMLSYELGWDQNIGKNLLTRLSLYYNDVKDLIYSVDIDSATKERQNVAKAEVFGMELEARYNLNKKWQSFVNYTFNRSKIKKHSKASLKNKFLTYTPENKANIGLTYDNPTFFRVDFVARYVGRVFCNDANTKKLKSHFILDLKISRELNENLEVALNIENLTDRQYQEYWKYLAPPRFISGSVRLRF